MRKEPTPNGSGTSKGFSSTATQPCLKIKLAQLHIVPELRRGRPQLCAQLYGKNQEAIKMLIAAIAARK